MKPVKDFPYRCEKCRFWRSSRLEKTNVCVNPESSYYGEETEPQQCCLNYVKKDEGQHE